MIYFFGVPAIFLTINSCDVHSHLSMVFSGKQFNLQTMEGFPSRRDRDWILANDPVACAKFCNYIFETTIHCLFGSSNGIGIGVFGKPIPYAGTVEE
jgi:hypothetical protein